MFDPSEQPEPSRESVDHDGDSKYWDFRATRIIDGAEGQSETAGSDGQDSENGLEIPASIGHYRPVSVLGHGGMGVVFLAQQDEPIKRNVALKIIKSSRYSKRIVARFELERQSLAIMNHPNVAKVYDAGIADDGCPFFAMELVEGAPLTEYSDSHRLTIEERLELFLGVCRGIEHAHQKGLIHRDLKPSNILVSVEQGISTPKIIDFGLAKLTEESEPLAQSQLTEYGQVLGTVQYMSPEQAELGATDIDTRTDIYSLGIILYELLTGSTPLERETIESKQLFHVLELIRNKEPRRPSSRLDSMGERLGRVCKNRRTSPTRLRQMVRGDLEWIILKAVEIDRSRRYASATQLAGDITNYINNNPVSARPPSTVYRLRKFVRRNRSAVAFSTIVAALLLASSVVSFSMAIRANAASRRSDAAKQRALDSLASVQEFVLDSPVWKSNNPGRHALIDLLSEEYQYWGQSMDERNDDIPLLASALVRLAALHHEVGRYEKSTAMAEKAIEVLAQHHDDESALFQIGMAEAEALFVEVGSKTGQSDLIGTKISRINHRLKMLDKDDLSRPLAERFCRIKQVVAGYYLSQKMPTTFRAANQCVSHCEHFLFSFPESQELKFIKAQALNVLAKSVYKGMVRNTDQDAEAVDVIETYDLAREIAEGLVRDNYRSLYGKRLLARIFSNKGMLLLMECREGKRELDSVIANYDMGLEICGGLLEEFPNNLFFTETKGNLLLNKAEAYEVFQFFKQESQLREEAQLLLAFVTDQSSFESYAGELLTLNQGRLMLNLFRIGNTEMARELGYDLYQREATIEDPNLLVQLLLFSLLLKHPEVEQLDQIEIVQKLDSVFEKYCDADLSNAICRPQMELLDKSPVFSHLRDGKQYESNWSKIQLALSRYQEK